LLSHGVNDRAVRPALNKEMVDGSDSMGLSVNTGCADREPIPHRVAGAFPENSAAPKVEIEKAKVTL